MELFNLFEMNMFGDDTEEVKAEIKEEVKKPSKAEPKKVEVADMNEEENFGSSASDIDDEEEDIDDGAMTTGEEEEEADSKKNKASTSKSSKKSTKLQGPVKIVGLGWTYEYGESGKEYTPLAVLKAAYKAGYREVAFRGASITTDCVSAIFVSSFATSSTYLFHDTDRIGTKISVEVGMNKAEYTTADFGDDISSSEVSAFDLMRKFTETHPDFEGFHIAVDRSICLAVPFISDSKDEAKLEDDCDVVIYNDGGNVTTHVDKFDDFKNEVVDGYGAGTKASFYMSDTDICFIVIKGKETLHVKPDSIVSGDYKKVENKAVEEVYRLPFVLVLPNLGLHKELNTDDFGGKNKIKKSDVIDFLKGQYTIFKSSNRQVIVDYEKSANIVSVMVAAGKKG